MDAFDGESFSILRPHRDPRASQPAILAKSGHFPNAAGVLEVRRVLQERFASMQTECPPVFTVYEVVDEAGRLFALKVGAADLVRRELSILRALDHPAIVRARAMVDALPVDAPKGHAGFTMDLVAGTDFLSWVRGDLVAPSEDAPRRNLPMAFGYEMQAEGTSAYGRCTERGLVRLRSAIGPLASALHATHQAGFVHFDLHPDNVLCDSGPVLVDFANAFSLDASVEGAHLYGIPEYVAPEFAESGRVTPQLDVYSLGVLLFEALTGRPPFVGGVEAMVSKLTLAPPAPSELVDDVPPDLDVLIVALLARSPADRPSLSELSS